MDIDEIEREMKALALEYMRELPERFRLLSRQVDEIKQGAGNPAAAKGEAHKIKGTASSYGAYEIGEQAVIIDECLKTICNKAESLNNEVWEKLYAALNEATRLAEAAVAAADAEQQ